MLKKGVPLGAKILGSLFIFGGLFGLCASVPLLDWPGIEKEVRKYLTETQQNTSELDELSAAVHAHRQDQRGFIDALFYLAVASSVCMAAGIGVLRLKNWARWLMLLSTVGWLWFSGTGYLTERRLERLYGHQWRPGRNPGDEELNMLLTLGWALLVFWYFLRPSIRAHFVQEE